MSIIVQVTSVKGVQNLTKKLKEFETEAIANQIKVVQDAVFLVHKTAVESIQANTDGTREYRYSSSGTKRMVAVSFPGDPPNTDTGRLVQSIQFEFSNGGLTGAVGTNLRYGRDLEFGTKKMAARPWLAPALNNNRKEISEMFREAIRKTVKGVTK